MLCLTDALPADGCARLLHDGGFALTGREDCSAAVLTLPERIDGLAKQGQIGYWRYTARKGE